MQMRRLYESTDKKTRAARYRADAIECKRKGLECLAECLYEHAEILDPTPREKPEREPRRRRRDPQTSRDGAGGRLQGPVPVRHTLPSVARPGATERPPIRPSRRPHSAPINHARPAAISPTR